MEGRVARQYLGTAFNTYKRLYDETAAASQDVRVYFVRNYRYLRGYSTHRSQMEGDAREQWTQAGSHLVWRANRSRVECATKQMDECINREKRLAFEINGQVVAVVQ